MTEDKRVAAIQVAIDVGLSVEDQDNRGYRPMHSAARAGYHEVIKFLLSKGAEKNPLTKPITSTYGLSQVRLEAQSPLGMAEGTVEAVFYARADTAAFLRELGFTSIGRYISAPPTDKGAGSTQAR